MGQNIVGIEGGTSAPIVKVVNTCTTAAFCNSALDQVIPMDYTNVNAPIYAFKGKYVTETLYLAVFSFILTNYTIYPVLSDNCMMQVSPSNGYLQPVGQPFPIETKLVGWRRKGLTAAYEYQNDNNSQLLIFDVSIPYC